MSKFVVISYFAMVGEPDEIMFHCDEPERDLNETTGGFEFHLANAILHDDRASAQKTRNRMQSYYPTFKMHVKEFSNKEIFLSKLEGAPDEL